MPAGNKPFWKSRMLYVNAAAAIVSLAIEFDNPILVAQVLAVINLVLRAITTQGLTTGS